VSRERSEVLWRQRAAQYAEQPDAAAFPQLARFHGQKSAWQRSAGCAFGTANVAERSCEVCLRTTFCCLLGDPKILEDRRRRGEEKRREVEAVKAVSRHVMPLPPTTAISADVAKEMFTASHFCDLTRLLGQAVLRDARPRRWSRRLDLHPGWRRQNCEGAASQQCDSVQGDEPEAEEHSESDEGNGQAVKSASCPSVGSMVQSKPSWQASGIANLSSVQTLCARAAQYGTLYEVKRRLRVTFFLFWCMREREKWRERGS
jgi:hypothetical protein